MRVVTLLPAATETVMALGGAGRLVGVSGKCDYPPAVTRLPRLTTTPIDTSGSSAVIDAYTSGPGPRVVDGVERLREAMVGNTMPGLERWLPAA